MNNLDNSYRSLLHIYMAEGKLKTDKVRPAIGIISDVHKKVMLNSLKTIVNDLEKQLAKEG